MKSLCLYSSYVIGDSIPYYVQFYLLQLLPHFSKIVYITNERDLNVESGKFLSSNGIEPMFVKNEGYDFGMWYKAFYNYAGIEHERVALINDSCILFKDLDTDFKRINTSGADFCGMVISDRYATHLQSFFLVLDNGAIKILDAHFTECGVISDYRQVIQSYEIGLTQRMLREGVKIFSLYNNKHRDHPKNPSFALVGELIENGMPMIKKKIVFRNYRGLEYYWVVRMGFNTDYRKYFEIIRRKYDTGLIDFDKVMLDAPRKGHFDLFLFAVAGIITRVLRKIPGMSWIFHRMVDVYKKLFRK